MGLLNTLTGVRGIIYMMVMEKKEIHLSLGILIQRVFKFP